MANRLRDVASRVYLLIQIVTAYESRRVLRLNKFDSWKSEIVKEKKYAEVGTTARHADDRRVSGTLRP